MGCDHIISPLIADHDQLQGILGIILVMTGNSFFLFEMYTLFILFSLFSSHLVGVFFFFLSNGL